MRKILAPVAWSLGAVLLIGAAVAIVVLPAHDDAVADPAPPTIPPLLALERDGLRYEIHLPTGAEALFDTASDPQFRVNVLDEHPDAARLLRRLLAQRHGVDDLDVLREHYRETTDMLKRLGYL